MRLRLIAILCVLSSSMVISGCEINNGQEERVSITPAPVVDTKKANDKNSNPSPKPRPKIEPSYPPAE